MRIAHVYAQSIEWTFLTPEWKTVMQAEKKIQRNTYLSTCYKANIITREGFKMDNIVQNRQYCSKYTILFKIDNIVQNRQYCSK